MIKSFYDFNPLRYRGYYYDRETGFYYLNSRYYDPKIGRFINADSYVSTGQGIVGYNMFAYCGNNPVNASDPMGESAVAVEWWLEEMWWLCGADTVLPIGDLAYAGGIVILGFGVLTEEEKVYSSYSTKVGKLDKAMFSKSKGKSKEEVDPYARPEQKKQGRENKNKARQKGNFTPRNNRRDNKPAPPKSHTPSRRGHKKY